MHETTPRPSPKAFANLLIQRFSFPADNVVQLYDEKATHAEISSAYLGFATDNIKSDDRLIIFFAGHGHTQKGHRGEVGFLVPVDGNTDDLASLIRWDHLTRDAELIPAKHILFVMDACYGGLAITRALSPGTSRFAKNMLQRFSRQVLTAGKADETVSDGDGPRPGHSMFTGYLLDALEGAAAATDNLITANNVMAYVYDRVAKDQYSEQTPHFGYIAGDGDFIFDLSPVKALDAGSDNEIKDVDILVTVSPSFLAQENSLSDQPIEDLVEEYLAEPRYRIKLHKLINNQIRKCLALIHEDRFSVQEQDVSPEAFASRLKQFEEAMRDMIAVVILLARWVDGDQRSTLRSIFSILPDAQRQTSGNNLWLRLRWYPEMLLMYAGGIAAISADNYDNLAVILNTKVPTPYSGDEAEPIVIPAVKEILDVRRMNFFKSLPGHERQHVPESEYLFKVLQPFVEDLLFLGNGYESMFDNYEVMQSLTFADVTYDESGRVWGPPGRFWYKYSSGMRRSNPFSELVATADQQTENWSPLRSGFFSGSYDRFKLIVDGYRPILDGVCWF